MILLKKIFFCCLLFGSVQSLHANDSLLLGKWKFIKMEVGEQVVFNLNDLLTSYRQFYKKQEGYNSKITPADSINIQQQFQKMVNDISKMFVEFKPAHRYETNKYGKDGAMLNSTETGTYYYNAAKKQIRTYTNGNKMQLVVLKLLAVSENELVFKYSGGSDAPVFTCRKIFKLPALRDLLLTAN